MLPPRPNSRGGAIPFPTTARPTTSDSTSPLPHLRPSSRPESREQRVGASITSLGPLPPQPSRSQHARQLTTPKGSQHNVALPRVEGRPPSSSAITKATSVLAGETSLSPVGTPRGDALRYDHFGQTAGSSTATSSEHYPTNDPSDDDTSETVEQRLERRDAIFKILSLKENEGRSRIDEYHNYIFYGSQEQAAKGLFTVCAQHEEVVRRQAILKQAEGHFQGRFRLFTRSTEEMGRGFNQQQETDAFRTIVAEWEEAAALQYELSRKKIAERAQAIVDLEMEESVLRAAINAEGSASVVRVAVDSTVDEEAVFRSFEQAYEAGLRSALTTDFEVFEKWLICQADAVTALVSGEQYERRDLEAGSSSAVIALFLEAVASLEGCGRGTVEGDAAAQHAQLKEIGARLSKMSSALARGTSDLIDAESAKRIGLVQERTHWHCLVLVDKLVAEESLQRSSCLTEERLLFCAANNQWIAFLGDVRLEAERAAWTHTKLEADVHEQTRAILSESDTRKRIVDEGSLSLSEMECWWSELNSRTSLVTAFRLERQYLMATFHNQLGTLTLARDEGTARDYIASTQEVNINGLFADQGQQAAYLLLSLQSRAAMERHHLEGTEEIRQLESTTFSALLGSIYQTVAAAKRRQAEEGVRGLAASLVERTFLSSVTMHTHVLLERLVAGHPAGYIAVERNESVTRSFLYQLGSLQLFESHTRDAMCFGGSLTRDGRLHPCSLWGAHLAMFAECCLALEEARRAGLDRAESQHRHLLLVAMEELRARKQIEVSEVDAVRQQVFEQESFIRASFERSADTQFTDLRSTAISNKSRVVSEELANAALRSAGDSLIHEAAVAKQKLFEEFSRSGDHDLSSIVARHLESLEELTRAELELRLLRAHFVTCRESEVREMRLVIPYLRSRTTLLSEYFFRTCSLLAFGAIAELSSSLEGDVTWFGRGPTLERNAPKYIQPKEPPTDAESIVSRLVSVVAPPSAATAASNRSPSRLSRHDIDLAGTISKQESLGLSLDGCASLAFLAIVSPFPAPPSLTDLGLGSPPTAALAVATPTSAAVPSLAGSTLLPEGLRAIPLEGDLEDGQQRREASYAHGPLVSLFQGGFGHTELSSAVGRSPSHIGGMLGAGGTFLQRRLASSVVSDRAVRARPPQVVLELNVRSLPAPALTTGDQNSAPPAQTLYTSPTNMALSPMQHDEQNFSTDHLPLGLVLSPVNTGPTSFAAPTSLKRLDTASNDLGPTDIAIPIKSPPPPPLTPQVSTPLVEQQPVRRRLCLMDEYLGTSLIEELYPEYLLLLHRTHLEGLFSGIADSGATADVCRGVRRGFSVFSSFLGFVASNSVATPSTFGVTRSTLSRSQMLGARSPAAALLSPAVSSLTPHASSLLPRRGGGRGGRSNSSAVVLAQFHATRGLHSRGAYFSTPATGSIIPIGTPSPSHLGASSVTRQSRSAASGSISARHDDWDFLFLLPPVLESLSTSLHDATTHIPFQDSPNTAISSPSPVSIYSGGVQRALETLSMWLVLELGAGPLACGMAPLQSALRISADGESIASVSQPYKSTTPMARRSHYASAAALPHTTTCDSFVGTLALCVQLEELKCRQELVDEYTAICNGPLGVDEVEQSETLVRVTQLAPHFLSAHSVIVDEVISRHRIELAALFQNPFAVGSRLRSDGVRSQAVIDHAMTLQIPPLQTTGLQETVCRESVVRRLTYLRGSTAAAACPPAAESASQSGSPRIDRRQQTALKATVQFPNCQDPSEVALLYWLTTTRDGTRLPAVRPRRGVTILEGDSADQVKPSDSVNAAAGAALDGIDERQSWLGPFAHLALLEKASLYERHWLHSTCDTVPWFTSDTDIKGPPPPSLFQSVFLQATEEREAILRFQTCYVPQSRELERIYVLFHMLIPVGIDSGSSEGVAPPEESGDRADSPSGHSDVMIPQHPPSVSAAPPDDGTAKVDDYTTAVESKPHSSREEGRLGYLPPLLRRPAVGGGWRQGRLLPTVTASLSASVITPLQTPKAGSSQSLPPMLSPNQASPTDYSQPEAETGPLSFQRALDDMKVSRLRLTRGGATLGPLPPLQSAGSGVGTASKALQGAGGGHVLKRLQQCLQQDRCATKPAAAPALLQSLVGSNSASYSTVESPRPPAINRIGGPAPSSTSPFAVIPASKFQPRNLTTALPENVSLPKRRDIAAATAAMGAVFSAATAASKWQRKVSSNALKREKQREKQSEPSSSVDDGSRSMSLRQLIALEEMELEKEVDEYGSEVQESTVGTLASMIELSAPTRLSEDEMRRSRRIDRFSSMLMSIVSEPESMSSSMQSPKPIPTTTSTTTYKPSVKKRGKWKTADQEDEEELAALETDIIAFVLGKGSLGGGKTVTSGPSGSIALSEGRRKARLLTNWSRGWWADNAPAAINGAKSAHIVHSPRSQLLPTARYTHLFKPIEWTENTQCGREEVQVHTLGASPQLNPHGPSQLPALGVVTQAAHRTLSYNSPSLSKPSHAPTDRAVLEEAYVRSTILAYYHEGCSKYVSVHLLTLKEMEGEALLEAAMEGLVADIEGLCFVEL